MIRTAKHSSAPRFRVLDLFSGIGGFALATEWAGGCTMAFAEVAEYPARILKAHWPDIPNLGDVTKLCRRAYDCKETDDESGNVWCPRCDAEFGECECIGTDQFTDTHGFPDVITGGVPCQPASLIGERLGSDDERWLWPETLRIMRELQPSYGIFENPPALLTLEDGRAFAGILGGLAALGYDVQWHCVSAGALGAGHRRERVWILATDANRPRLEGHAGHGARDVGPGPHRSAPTPNLRDRIINERQWYAQSGIQPVVNGLPGRLAREQLTAVGNSLVPQVAHVWLRAIATFYATEIPKHN